MQIGRENTLGFSEVYIFFENADSLWWLQFLKKGFRHCFLLLVARENKTAILLNPRSNQTDVELFSNCDIDDLIKSYASYPERTMQRLHFFPTIYQPAPIMFFTCVEFAKRILGIHDITIITPYQLYKKIKKSRKNVLTF